MASSPLRWIVRQIGAWLPTPRDEALLLLVRSGLDFIRGRRPGSSVTISRMIRERVSEGWLLVDAHERLGASASEIAFRNELDAWYEYAHASIESLTPWGQPIDVYENANNRLRFRRTLDFVFPGDRIFDAGCGRGYLCGLLIRDGGVSAYHAIDVVPRFVDATRDMLFANELEGVEVALEVGDLFKLTRARLERTRADLVICCEVLEHVSDPERALETLAAALPKGSDLLFSVPLLGRLEGVWGHVTVFDTKRLRRMTKRAGLHVHHIEPVANQWTLVIASNDVNPSRRVLQARTRPPQHVTTRNATTYDFQAVNPAAFTPVASPGVEAHLSESESGRLRCRVERKAETPAVRGGISFPVPGLSSLRVELTFPDGGRVDEVRIEAYAGDSTVGVWTWNPHPNDMAADKLRRFGLRPGEPSGPARPFGFEEDSPIDRVEVLMVMSVAREVAFDIRVQVLP